MSATPKVYSYIRFSHIAQAEGASAQRQLDYAAAWAKKAGMVLDETLRDEGLSAYSGEHVSKGALGRFLQAVKDGTVPRGSVLVVEAFDRLSRDDPMEAQAQLRELVNAGLVVVTAKDGKEWSKATIKKQPTDLIMSMMSMILAHEESANKAKRVTDAFRRQCQGWLDGSYRGLIRSGNTPGWLRVVGGKYDFIPEQVAVIQHAAVAYRAGHTATQIAKDLHSAGLTIGTREPTSAHVTRLLTYPSLVGDKTITLKGETFDLTDYYPPVMSRADWNELQHLITSRTRKFVRGEIPSMLTGIDVAECGYCGAPMRAHTLMGKRRPDGTMADCHRRLMCVRSNHGGGCDRPGSCSAAPIERALMAHCSKMLNLRALVGGDRSSLRRNELAAAEAELAGAEKALARLTEVMLATEGNVDYLAGRTRDLEAIRAAAQAKVKQAAKALEDSTVDITGADKKWQAVVDGVNALDYDARMTARQLVADTFERIVVYHAGRSPTVTKPRGEVRIDIVLKAKGGDPKWLRVTDMDGTCEVIADIKVSARGKRPGVKPAEPAAKKPRARATA